MHLKDVKKKKKKKKKITKYAENTQLVKIMMINYSYEVAIFFGVLEKHLCLHWAIKTKASHRTSLW
jgi:hypothetical protein